MIIVRAPLRISFVGGGTDLADFYTKSPGRVLSAAIDKYVYVSIKRSPLMQRVHARYSEHESVEHPRKLKNDRIREALLTVGITDNIEISTFSDFPGNTGLGSSSSFAVALMKGIRLCLGERVDSRAIAEEAARLEIQILKEPIGKQDHYAAAIGGCNVLQFNTDHSVGITPVHLGYKKTAELEDHILLFFTGVTRKAKGILTRQRANIPKKMEALTYMAGMVEPFQRALLAGDFKSLGGMLAHAWEFKQSLAPGITNPDIDALYRAGINGGAWGGKVLGAGGGGCILFIASPRAHKKIREKVTRAAKRHKLSDFTEVPVRLVHSGVEVLLDSKNV